MIFAAHLLLSVFPVNVMLKLAGNPDEYKTNTAKGPQFALLSGPYFRTRCLFDSLASSPGISSIAYYEE